MKVLNEDPYPPSLRETLTAIHMVAWTLRDSPLATEPDKLRLYAGVMLATSCGGDGTKGVAATAIWVIGSHAFLRCGRIFLQLD